MSCCPEFNRARQHGTDNEARGRLVLYVEVLGYQIGHDLPAMRFCPWCGTALRPPPPTINLERTA